MIGLLALGAAGAASSVLAARAVTYRVELPVPVLRWAGRTAMVVAGAVSVGVGFGVFYGCLLAGRSPVVFGSPAGLLATPLPANLLGVQCVGRGRGRGSGGAGRLGRLAREAGVSEVVGGRVGRAARRASNGLSGLVYALYVRRLHRAVAEGPLPEHVGLIMDGNRRWARQLGLANPSLGHRYGAEHVEDVLGWCQAVGIRHVTVFVCSTENLLRRADTEIAYLMRVIEDVVTKWLSRPDDRWRVHLAGMLDQLPDTTARALKNAAEATRNCQSGHVTLAVGYGGRQEVTEALRELLHERARAGLSPRELAASITTDDIARHLHTAGPDPDLIIRTSGEQRMSNFLLWQSAHAELHFCDAYWPAFREIDFLRALRGYAARQRSRYLAAPVAVTD